MTYHDISNMFNHVHVCHISSYVFTAATREPSCFVEALQHRCHPPEGRSALENQDWIRLVYLVAVVTLGLCLTKFWLFFHGACSSMTLLIFLISEQVVAAIFNSISGQGRRMIVQRSNGAKGGRRWKECKSKSSSLNGNPRSSKSSKSCKPGVLRKPWKQGRLRGHMRLSSSKWKRFSELSFGLGLWECPPTGRYRWCLQLAVLPKCRDKQGQASEAAKQGRSVAAQAHAWKVQSEVEHQAAISEI